MQKEKLLLSNWIPNYKRLGNEQCSTAIYHCEALKHSIDCHLIAENAGAAYIYIVTIAHLITSTPYLL